MATAPSGEKSKSIIVIKRIKKGGHGGHSAAWKIAYADFVTAMMAFFLLMWLLGSTTKGDLKGIADYFNSPMQVAMSGGDGSGDATSVIKGGGTDLTRSAGQVKRGANTSRKRTPYSEQEEKKKSEREDMRRLKSRIDEAIQMNLKLSEVRDQIRVEITPDGLRIQIIDDFKRPMFALGSAAVMPYMRDVLHEIGKVLNGVDNHIALTGHTDSAQYVGGVRGYSNWELSSDRANASRRELIVGGMQGEKVVRVVGLADSALLDKEEPKSPLNRRISIIVLNKSAGERMAQAGGEIEVGNSQALSESLNGPTPDAEATAPAEPEISAAETPNTPAQANAANAAPTAVIAPAQAPDHASNHRSSNARADDARALPTSPTHEPNAPMP